MPTRTYTVTPDQLVTIRADLAALGKPLPPGNAGSFNPPGHPEVDLGYVYTGDSKLQVTILDDAWWETSGDVWDALDKYMPAGSLPAS